MAYRSVRAACLGPMIIFIEGNQRVSPSTRYQRHFVYCALPANGRAGTGRGEKRMKQKDKAIQDIAGRTCWGKSEKKEFRKPFCQTVSLIESIDSSESDGIVLFHNSLSCINRHNIKASQGHGVKQTRCTKYPSHFKVALHSSVKG